jgi:biopolymer transport protein ExbD
MKLTLSLIAIILVSLVCTSCQTNSKNSSVLPTEEAVSSNGVTISIANDSGISLGSEKIAVDNLLSKLKSQGIKKSETIVIRADKEIRHDAVTKVLDQLSKGNYSKVHFSTNK